MLSRYDFIYLSPHFDDAALSCGGQIYSRTKAGKTILIVTLMAGEPPDAEVTGFARSMHDRWQLTSNVVAERSAEDVEACRILGADHFHLEIPDCIYRLHPQTREPLYVSEDEIFGKIHTADRALVEELALRIEALPEAGQLIIPLTVGNHVDHQITRAAAEYGRKSGLLFYEDYPYVREPGALEAVIGVEDKDWSPMVIRLDQSELRTKAESILAYASQVNSFFADNDDLVRQINEYARYVGGERIWRKKSD